jgi:hypothetical protein
MTAITEPDLSTPRTGRGLAFLFIGVAGVLSVAFVVTSAHRSLIGVTVGLVNAIIAAAAIFTVPFLRPRRRTVLVPDPSGRAWHIPPAYPSLALSTAALLIIVVGSLTLLIRDHAHWFWLIPAAVVLPGVPVQVSALISGRPRLTIDAGGVHTQIVGGGHDVPWDALDRSASLTRRIGIAHPDLVTTRGRASRRPSTIAIDYYAVSDRDLATILDQYLADPSLRAAIGTPAEHVRLQHTLSRP